MDDKIPGAPRDTSKPSDLRILRFEAMVLENNHKTYSIRKNYLFAAALIVGLVANQKNSTFLTRCLHEINGESCCEDY